MINYNADDIKNNGGPCDSYDLTSNLIDESKTINHIHTMKQFSNFTFSIESEYVSGNPQMNTWSLMYA